MIEICSELYGGEGLFSKKRSPYSADIIYCEDPDKCPLYKLGQCLQCRRLSRKPCKFGRVSRISGSNPGTKSYSKVAVETRARESYMKLAESGVAFCKIADNYYFSTSFVNLYEDTRTDRKSVV